jgi:hypothetical protein
MQDIHNVILRFQLRAFITADQCSRPCQSRHTPDALHIWVLSFSVISSRQRTELNCDCLLIRKRLSKVVRTHRNNADRRFYLDLETSPLLIIRAHDAGWNPTNQRLHLIAKIKDLWWSQLITWLIKTFFDSISDIKCIVRLSMISLDILLMTSFIFRAYFWSGMPKFCNLPRLWHAAL